MKRTVIFVTSLVAMLILIAQGTPADSVTLNVVSPADVSQGSTFAVDVNISGVADLYAFQLDLDFDPSVLSLTSVSEGVFLPSGGSTFFIPGTIDNVGGSVTGNADTLLTAISGVSGTGTLIVFDFNALTSGTSALDLANITLLDSGLNNIDFTSTNSEVMVTGGAIPTPEPNTLILLTVGLLSLGLSATFRRMRRHVGGASVPEFR